MKKLKIYLDTSVISHLNAPDAPERQADTWALWEDLKMGVYNVFTSPVLLEEISRCNEPKRGYMLDRLNEIPHTEIAINDEITALGACIINAEILPPKSVLDSLHIAAALSVECDYLVSWNFKHMSNIRTNNGIRIIAIEHHCRELLLLPPSMLLNRGE
ncbi:hypothetical protein FACS18949_10520 [Clostridia bacterium]|nr:hypothetical protein FACS18949_10520 [Clostridia bacterium]